MSAFVVNKATIDAMTTFWKTQGYSFKNSDEATYAGEMLWKQNVDSVNYRYKDSPHISSTPYYVYAELHIHDGKRLQAVDIIKITKCWQYQSSDNPNYETTRAWKLSNEILNLAINKLPGYDDAPYGL